MYKVLIVEDNPLIRKGIIKMLDWSSFDGELIAEVNNGREALDCIRKNQIDLVITDIQMPDVNGLELIKILSDDYDIDVIVISAYDNFSYAKQAIVGGCINYILKPISPVELNAAVQKAYRIRNQTGSFSLYSLEKEIEEYLPLDSVVLSHKIKEYIDSCYNENLSLESISKLFHTDKFYLSKMFKKEFGDTVKQYIIKRRISKAKELLASKALSIEQITEMSGFSDATYFIRVFKEHTGITPGKYEGQEEE